MARPEKAKKVFSGVIHDVYQWDQEMFDGTTATFESVDRQNSTIIIVEFEDRYVMSKQEQPGRPPFVSLIGGRVDRNETPEENAHLELREEAGMTTSDLQLLGEWKPGGKMDYSIFVYFAKNCKRVGDPKPESGGEKIELFYVTFDEMCEYLDGELTRGDGKVIKELLHNKMSQESKEKLRGMLK